ncbi:MAG: glycosyltransferase family 9 protein [Geobacter sp.]|nr:glycosyltransferase family 9 protein [Geobacter sp.]
MRVATDRVCIVMMSAIGDAVHVLPVLHSLKRANPAMKVTWILQPGPAALVRGHHLVDEIILFDRSKGLQGFMDIRNQLQQRSFDLAISLQVYLKANFILSFVQAPVKLGFDRARARDLNWLFTTHKIDPRPMQHVQDQYLEFCSWLGAPTEPVTWELGPWNPEERRWQSEFYAAIDRPAAAIVVATSKLQKNWLPERWAEVCDSLYADFGMQPVLVGGKSPVEMEFEKVIMEKATHKPVTALGNGGLRGLVGILDGATLVLSPDTGPLHITVALDRPVISLIGYSNPKRVGPYRKFADLMIDAYGEPGEDYPISMENRTDRMPRIQVRDVLDKIQHWRSDYQ